MKLKVPQEVTVNAIITTTEMEQMIANASFDVLPSLVDEVRRVCPRCFNIDVSPSHPTKGIPKARYRCICANVHPNDYVLTTTKWIKNRVRFIPAANATVVQDWYDRRNNQISYQKSLLFSNKKAACLEQNDIDIQINPAIVMPPTHHAGQSLNFKSLTSMTNQHFSGHIAEPLQHLTLPLAVCPWYIRMTPRPFSRKALLRPSPGNWNPRDRSPRSARGLAR